MKPALGIAVGNQTNLCQATQMPAVRILSHAELIENLPEVAGAHQSLSSLDGEGTKEEGIACVNASEALPGGHAQAPLWIMDETLEFRGSLKA